MIKTIKVNTCADCPHLRYPWNCALSKTYACGNSFKGENRPRGEKHWLGGDALPGDKLIMDINIMQTWCELKSVTNRGTS